MKIYDHNSKRTPSSMTLYLKPDEAAELSSGLKELSENLRKHHSHIMDNTGKNEIIIAVYTNETKNQFDDESKMIIEKE